MLNPTLAHIRRGSPRAADWIRVFGAESLRIKSPVPQRSQFPDGIHDVYFVDVDALTPEQIERAVADIATRFKIPPAEVLADLRGAHGFPLHADDARLVL